MFHACVAFFRAEPGRISQCLFNGGVFQSVQSVLLVDGGGCGITYLSSNRCVLDDKIDLSVPHVRPIRRLQRRDAREGE